MHSHRNVFWVTRLVQPDDGGVVGLYAKSLALPYAVAYTTCTQREDDMIRTHEACKRWACVRWKVKMQRDNDELKAERDALRAFAQAVMESWPNGDVDGGVLQELAHEHGLLHCSEQTVPCSEECACEYYCVTEEVIDCYRPTPLLTGEEPK